MINKIPSLDLWYEPSPFQNRNAYLQKNHNWDVLNKYGLQLSNYILDMAQKYDTRINEQINSVEQPSEVIDARISLDGTINKNLKERLDGMEENKADSIANGTIDELGTLRLVDLDENSSPVKMGGVTSFDDDGNNPYSRGLVISKLKNFTFGTAVNIPVGVPTLQATALDGGFSYTILKASTDPSNAEYKISYQKEGSDAPVVQPVDSLVGTITNLQNDSTYIVQAIAVLGSQQETGSAQRITPVTKLATPTGDNPNV